MEGDKNRNGPRGDGDGTAGGQTPHHDRDFYRLGANPSTSSVLEDVEMAQEELFSGPMAESLPTSVSAFHHHRQRAESVSSSFAYYDEGQDLGQDGEDEPYLSDFSGVHVDHIEEGPDWQAHDDESEDSFASSRRTSTDDFSSIDRRLSVQESRSSRDSTRAHLLRRDSLVSSTSVSNGARLSQKIYMENEDLTVVIAGFKTTRMRSFAYNLICILTLGLAYLLFRWLPTWKVKLLGVPTPLYQCQWVVIENQWKEFSTVDVLDGPYQRPMSTVFGASSKEYGRMYDMDPDLDRLRIIDYRHVRFCYNPHKDRFLLCNGWQDPTWVRVAEVRVGLETNEKNSRERVFGKNLIDIEEKSVFKLLVDEVFHPFYMFQVVSLILWMSDDYYYYAGCIFFISAITITSTIIDTRGTMKRLRELARFECDVRVVRNGFWSSVGSSDLVPGDIYEVSDPSLALFPCDSLLLSGDCIVNESMLTGESVPVSKVPATDKTLVSLDLSASTAVSEVARHFLFCGTKIIRVRRPKDDRHNEASALAMVLRTGFNTTKGSLVRSMLFPKPSGFKFYRDSFRYITVMACVAAVGFIASFVNFVRLGMAPHLIIVRALDLITIVVPPALPATLTIGTSFAISRLKKKQIFCISLQRINVAGKIDLMCFDKTGTLTEDGLDILGVRVAHRTTNKFSNLLTAPENLADPENPEVGGPEDLKARIAILHAMATCHTLRVVDDELVGDPLELKMFDFTGWSFEEGGHGAHGDDSRDETSLAPSVARPPPGIQHSLDGNGDIQTRTVGRTAAGLAAPSANDSSQQSTLELGVLRSFEFVSQLRRASVIVRPFGGKSGDIFVKGAPECMRDICRLETLPADYDELLAYYTHKGYRVIACATRHIKKLSWVKTQKMKRHDVESQLDFVGFIIFENKLKPTTAGVLDELRRSNLSTVMVTGDNILTAISVARESGLVDKNAHCFVPHFATGRPGDRNAELKWESIDNPLFRLDPDNLVPLSTPTEADASLPFEIDGLRNFCLAVTGEVFRWIIDYAPDEVVKRTLVRGKVFARMSPDEKHELVEKFQSIEYCTGFCGDGANDCGALKAADVGISLSEAEASVAAPFTSRIFDISCVPEVIREGRAALVTSFSCFKYMSLYSAIQFTTVSFLYAFGSNLGDFQYLFIDLALILPIAIFMAWAGPYPVLSRKRPTADLVSRKVLTPLLGQMGICVLSQMIVFLVASQQPWYIPPHPNPNDPNIANSANTSLFLFSTYEYILIAVILSAGPPFRRGIFYNRPFVLTVALALATSTYLVLGPAKALRVMQLTDIPVSFKCFVVGMGVLFFGVSWVCERFVFGGVARVIGRLGGVKRRKEYKVVEERVWRGVCGEGGEFTGEGDGLRG